MPGVPKEMKIMFARSILPELEREAGRGVILSKTLHTFGAGESTIAEKLGALMKRDRNPSVGTTVSSGIVSLRINARFDTKQDAQRELEATAHACAVALGDLIFGADTDTLPQVVADLLKQSKKTVTTAESCTGGLLAKYLTDLSGSSDYFKQGWITYADEAKTSLLGVSESILREHGAVSEPVAKAMAIGARERAKSDFALAITGIAGPTGGTEAKPVGTVCLALADSDKVTARKFLFSGDREMIRDRSAKMALTMLRYHLIGKVIPF
jgi:nicotinamide-nucleotide amidase